MLPLSLSMYLFHIHGVLLSFSTLLFPVYLSPRLFLSPSLYLLFPPSLILDSLFWQPQTPFKLVVACEADDTNKKWKTWYLFLCLQTDKHVTSWLWWGDVGLLVSHSEQNKQVLVCACVCVCLCAHASVILYPNLWGLLSEQWTMFSEKGLAATARHLPFISLQFGPLCYPANEGTVERLKLHSSLWVAWPILMSTSAMFLFLLPYCLLIVLLSRQLSALALPQRLIKPKNIVLYHLMSRAGCVSLSTCYSTELIWLGTMRFVYLYVIVWAIYAASTLEGATLNTNLLCSFAAPLPLHGYLPLLDGSQTQIYGWRLK